ncbi:MAG TPA: GNAT family N-acetyltransferase [Longimicrobium sp.]|nr:GNAT family N-acetyltransferase [Longimicrobium sp.]
MSPPEGMRIVPLRAEDRDVVRQAAELLVEGFRADWPDAWPRIEDALAELATFATDDERVAWAAVDADGSVLGWIGAIHLYDGNVWELHPLVVHPDHRGRGVGRALVELLADAGRQAGAFTLWVGTDDEAQMTSLGGVDLYPGLLEKLREIRDLRRHPFGFYQRLGFEVAGVVPDANGFGKPDILLARRLQAR